MIKTELKSLINDIYGTLNDLVDNNEDLTKKNVSDFLLNSQALISCLSKNELSSYKKSKDILEKEFNELSNECLASYKLTNSKFSELSQVHADAIIQCTGENINVPKLTDKFAEIQTFILDEVNRANLVIEELSQQVQTLEKKSNIDSLTKVYNRGSLTTYLDDLCTNATNDYDTYMLILDIDDFKKINDTFGHVAGDKILIYISNILKKTLRDGDRIFRYGGEEFIIVISRVTQRYSINIGNRILKLISENNLIYMGDNINITASIGVTKFKLGDTSDSFIARADKALYKSKHNGKNQLTLESSENGI